MGFFRRYFGGTNRSNEREARNQRDAGTSSAQGLKLYPDQVSWMQLQNALERCAASLTLASARLERLSEYYDQRFTGSDFGGTYKQSATAFRIAASSVNSRHNLLSHPEMDFDERQEYFEAHARNVGRGLDMLESSGYDKNVNETMDVVEQALRDLLSLDYRAVSVLQGFRDPHPDRHGFCEDILRLLRGYDAPYLGPGTTIDGRLPTLFVVYFNLSSYRMRETHPRSLTFIPDLAYDPRLTEGWEPYQIPEPAQSGSFRFAQPAKFEFDPNLIIIRTSNSEEEYTPFEKTAYQGREGTFVPTCSDGESSYFDALVAEWVTALGPGLRHTPHAPYDDDPEAF